MSGHPRAPWLTRSPARSEGPKSGGRRPVIRNVHDLHGPRERLELTPDPCPALPRRPCRTDGGVGRPPRRSGARGSRSRPAPLPGTTPPSTDPARPGATPPPGDAAGRARSERAWCRPGTAARGVGRPLRPAACGGVRTRQCFLISSPSCLCKSCSPRESRGKHATVPPVALDLSAPVPVRLAYDPRPRLLLVRQRTVIVPSLATGPAFGTTSRASRPLHLNRGPRAGLEAVAAPGPRSPSCWPGPCPAPMSRRRSPPATSATSGRPQGWTVCSWRRSSCWPPGAGRGPTAGPDQDAGAGGPDGRFEPDHAGHGQHRFSELGEQRVLGRPPSGLPKQNCG